MEEVRINNSRVINESNRLPDDVEDKGNFRRPAVVTMLLKNSSMIIPSTSSGNRVDPWKYEDGSIILKDCAIARMRTKKWDSFRLATATVGGSWSELGVSLE